MLKKIGRNIVSILRSRSPQQILKKSAVLRKQCYINSNQEAYSLTM